jgi:hypothetical protein
MYPQNLNDAIVVAKRVEEESEITMGKMSENINQEKRENVEEKPKNCRWSIISTVVLDSSPQKSYDTHT